MSKSFLRNDPEAKRADLEELGRRCINTRKARTRQGWRICACGDNYEVPLSGKGSRRQYCSTRCKWTADEAERERLERAARAAGVKTPQVIEEEEARAAWANEENEADLPRVFKLDGESYQFHLDVWYPVLRDYVEGREGSIENVRLWGAISMDIDKRTWRDNVRFGAIMRALGFERKATKLHGRTWIIYRRKRG